MWRLAPVWPTRPSCFGSPGTRRERTDHFHPTVAQRQIADQLGNGQIEHSQAERAEYRHGLAAPGRRAAPEDVGERAADEVPVTRELFRQVHRCLGAADVPDVVNDVVAGEYEIGAQIPQRGMEDRAPARALGQVAEV